MKLARYRSRRDGEEHVGIVTGLLVTPIGPGDGEVGQALLLATAMTHSASFHPELPHPVGEPERLEAVQLLAPIPLPPSIRDFYAFEAHVATARRSRGLEVPPDWYELPTFYFSNPAAVVGPDAPIAAPPDCAELDYELEVAAIIGTACHDVAPHRWRDVVAGFTVMNDWSARDLQRREMALGLGPAKGKDFATSLGPVLVTPTEVLRGRDAPWGAMTASVDGEEWSRGELGDLHHGWGALIAHASRGTHLRPGDVIGSGTVGTGCILELGLVHGHDRYPWLQPGSAVTLTVEGIGSLTNPITG